MKRDVFQAIADPTRRAILLLLATQAMTPNALAEQFDTSRQAVSKHIKILNECRLLEREKSGREIYYRLRPEQLREVDQWLGQLRRQWEDRFDQLDGIFNNLNTESDEG